MTQSNNHFTSIFGKHRNAVIVIIITSFLATTIFCAQEIMAVADPDMNGDGEYNVEDVNDFKDYFNTNDTTGDFYVDGKTNILDFAVMMKAFSEGIPPSPDNAWNQLGQSASGGGISKSSGNSYEPSVAFDSSGNPHVAWKDDTSGENFVYYAYWNGSRWQAHLNSNSGKGVSSLITPDNGSDPSLVLDSQNRPHIAWAGKTLNADKKRIYYAYWNGSSWAYPGSSKDNHHVAGSIEGFEPSLQLDSDQRPHIAWGNKDTGNSNTYYAFWDGNSWEGRQGSNSGSGLGGKYSDVKGTDASLALDTSDNPHIVWSGRKSGEEDVDFIFYAYWDGGSWKTRGDATEDGISTIPGNDLFPSIALDSENRPYVAWAGGKSAQPGSVSVPNIYMTYWNDNSWVGLGESNDYGKDSKGLSNTADMANSPVIRIDSEDNPHVAWYQRLDSSRERHAIKIRYRNWNGSAWKTKDSGDLGTSMTSDKYKPGFDLDPWDSPGIAWQNFNGEQQEIFYRQWGPSTEEWKVHYIDMGAGGADGTDLKDIDNDGDMDITTGWEQIGKVKLYINNGPQNEWEINEVCGSCPRVEDSHMVDLDADGDVDVVSAHEGDIKKINVHWAQDQRYTRWQTAELPASKGRLWLNVDSGKIDSDNRVDLVAGSTDEDSGVFWFKSPSNPANLSEWEIHEIAKADWIMGLVLSDMDKDGDLDVLVSDREDKVAWFRNSINDPTAEQPWKEFLIGTTCAARWFDYVDLDQDNNKDVVVADSCGDQTAITWFEGGVDPASVPWPKQWPKHTIKFSADTDWTTEHSKAVAGGDIDGDGKNDLAVVTAVFGHRIYWLNSTTNVFDDRWKGQLIFDDGEPAKFDEVQLLDLDADGDLDILTSEEKRLGVFWYENMVNR
ncbi:FG-GAP-like repeat-containing protein [Patescibacteria group bacterium]